MTVGELINTLSKFDPNKKIKVCAYYDNMYYRVVGDIDEVADNDWPAVEIFTHDPEGYEDEEDEIEEERSIKK